jgi:hypothetical protein
VQVRALVAAAEFTGEASMECYKAGPLLGQGAFSKVYTGYHRLTGQKVALKQYDKLKLEKSPVLLAAVRRATRTLLVPEPSLGLRGHACCLESCAAGVVWVGGVPSCCCCHCVL